MSSIPHSESAAALAGDKRAALKIYLGYASHTGKTWRLLEEARRRQARGQVVVIGWLREKDQGPLSHLLAGLEVIPSRNVDGQAEMDTEAILKRAPHVCIIDELAHANPPGSARAHRWEDVNALLKAGIGVVTALNIQYIAGLRSTVIELLGKAPDETVPDEIVRGADEVVLVDANLDFVLQRPRSGPDLSERDVLALRELALRYAANAVEEDVQEYRHEHRIEDVWETQERILVCLTAYARGPHLIEKAHQVTERWKGELWAIYVAPDTEWSHLSQDDAARVRSFLDLAKLRGARVEIVQDLDPAHGILTFARQHDITQIFLGHAAAYPFRGALSRTVAGRIIHEAEGMDVHVVADDRRKGSPRGVAPPRLPESLARLLSGTPRLENRGHERIYLGYAPGVGKTFQMLLDGRYLRDHGQDVVVGFCDPHDREDVMEQLRSHEVIPPLGGRNMDVEAVLRRRPQVCLVDGLAAPGSDGGKRWQEVGRLLDTGMHVFTTLDISEVESLRDPVERITGVPVRHTVPDWLLEEADEVVLVDVATRALLNRVKRGAVFPGTGVPDDMERFFTEGSLNALRELAMRLTADLVEDDLEAMVNGSATRTPQDAVLVCLDQRPSGASLVRRARRVADRLDVPCYAVFVVPDEDWTGVPPENRAAVEAHVDLARSLHIETHVLHGSHVARTVIDFAIRHGVAQIFMGRSRKTGWREFFQRSVIEQVIRLGPWMDIHVAADRVLPL